jgi:hypothetical protein
MTERTNEDLDAFMAETEPGPPRRRRRKRVVKLSPDKARRRAFRLLALLSDLEAPHRERVLRIALELSGHKGEK